MSSSDAAVLIEARVRELDDVLVGPRRLKADMLCEVRDGLADTAESFEREGDDPVVAAVRAVGEFGDLGVVGRDFQAELMVRQARVLLGLVAVTGPVSEVFARFMWVEVPLVTRPSTAVSMLAMAVDVAGWSLSLIAVGLMVSFGFGSRWFVSRPYVVRIVAWASLAKLVMFAVAGVLLVRFFNIAGEPSLSGMLLIHAVAQPVVWLLTAWLAWRCLRAVSTYGELSR